MQILIYTTEDDYYLMPELKILDDLQAPGDTLKVRFKGPNPAAVLGMIPELLKNVMKISSKDTFETDMRWDAIGSDNGFYGVWMGKRGEDNWTKTFIRVLVQGDQSIADKTGKFELQLKGFIETSYNYSNSFQRMFWLFYNRHFYNEQRRKYIEEGKQDMFDIKEEIMSRFKILQED